MEIRASKNEGDWQAARNKMARELEWVRKQPKARESKSKSRIEAFQKLSARVAEGTAAERERGTVTISAGMQRFPLGWRQLDICHQKQVIAEVLAEFEETLCTCGKSVSRLRWVLSRKFFVPGGSSMQPRNGPLQVLD